MPNGELPGSEGKRRGTYSRDYQDFKESIQEESQTIFERIALYISSFIDLGFESLPGLSEYCDGLQNNLDTARMDIGIQELLNMLIVPGGLLFLLSIGLTVVNPSIGIVFWLILMSYVYWVLTYPGFRADVTRIKIADESLDLMLNLAMNLRINPSLVNSIEKSARNTGGHLGRDISEILWNVETKYTNTLKDVLSEKMKDWRNYSSEFVESLGFLIDSTSQRGDKRRKMIQRGQTKMIEDVKEKMSQFARDLSSPVKVLNMVGIMLPLMGLIMFPLITIFLGGNQTVGNLIIGIAVGYVVVLPLVLYFFVKRLISKRPGAYNQPSLDHVEDLPPKDQIVFNFRGSTYRAPLHATSILIGLLIALPGILYYLDLFITMGTVESTVSIAESSVEQSSGWQAFIRDQYEIQNLVPNVIQGLSLIWGIAAGLIVYFYGRSYKRISIRRKIKDIEDKMILTLTELQNELSKNKPIENCFYAVVEKLDRSGLEDHAMREFFKRAFDRMNDRNQPFHRALFNDNILQDYPSPTLINTMEIIDSSVSKGPKAIENNVKNVREYVENQEEVERTISELLDEVVSQMKIQGRFIAPIITAAAGSIALIIVEVLFQLSEALDEISKTLSVGSGPQGGTDIASNVGMIQNLDSALPPTVLILVTGLYLTEISLILAYFTNGIENGFDEISKDVKITKFLVYAIAIYSVVVLVVTVFITPSIPGMIEV